MKISNHFKSIAALSAMCFCGVANAQNPIIQTKYTADPAPMVYNDTVFLYVDHDEDEDIGFFNMKNWMMYKSTDMVNWTDCGEVASLKTFSKWGRQDNGAWALQCMPRNGKFYLYCPVQLSGIGVAVAKTPYGPFVDPIGKPLVKQGSEDIDPTIFIDDDNQAYLYWGNPKPFYVKMNSNMVSYSGGIETWTAEQKPEKYVEGPWLTKRNGLYYLLYAASGIPENLAYATSDSPLGPWTYRGIIMPTQGSSFTNHCGVIDFKGNSYLFYHNGALPGGGGYKRSVCVEQFTYNADGTFPTINMTTQGVTKAVDSLNPYQRVEAETMAYEKGIETNRDASVGMYVDSISNGDYIKVRSVNFGKDGAAMFAASVACNGKGAKIELHLDNLSGTLVSTLPVNYTTGKWKQEKAVVKNCSGVHDLFIVFRGDAGNATLFKFDHWKMFPKSTKHILLGVNAY
jgi:arabinoxylan arabinofuranohydrolase